MSTSAPTPTTPAEATAPAVTPAAPAGGTSGQYVVTEGSEITFTVGEVLSRFPTPIEAVLRTSKLSGQINLDGQPSTVEVDLHSLNSDQQYRDRYVKLQMFPQHPVATFTVDSVTELPGEFDSGDTFQHSVSGTPQRERRRIPDILRSGGPQRRQHPERAGPDGFHLAAAKHSGSHRQVCGVN